MAQKVVFGYDEKNSYKAIFSNQNILVVLLSTSVFIIPFLFSHIATFPNQLIVGTLVNAILAYSALRFSFFKTFPIIVLPSIGALLSGLIFGAFSPNLVYLMLFIWIGNAAFVCCVKDINKNYFKNVLLGSVIKTFVIASATIVFILFGLIPIVFFIPMSIMQLVTAICGGIIGTLSFKRNVGE